MSAPGRRHIFRDPVDELTTPGGRPTSVSQFSHFSSAVMGRFSAGLKAGAAFVMLARVSMLPLGEDMVQE